MSTTTQEHYLSASFQLHNRFLRVCLAVGCIAMAAEGVAIYRLATAVSNVKVPIILVPPEGFPRIVNYADAKYSPHELELRAAIYQWATGYYSRDRFTLADSYGDSLKFFASKLQQEAITEENTSKWIETFVTSAQPQIKIQIRNVTLSDLSRSPYTARITFEKVFYSDNQAEAKRESWVSDIAFTVSPQVGNDPVNPLGILIQYVHETKAFD